MTFREIALAKIEEGIADLARDGLVDDRAGVLAGAMVDAATIAVQDWLRAGVELVPRSSMAPILVGLIRAAGKVAQ